MSKFEIRWNDDKDRLEFESDEFPYATYVTRKFMANDSEAAAKHIADYLSARKRKEARVD